MIPGFYYRPSAEEGLWFLSAIGIQLGKIVLLKVTPLVIIRCRSLGKWQRYLLFIEQNLHKNIIFRTLRILIEHELNVCCHGNNACGTPTFEDKTVYI